jgi:hypothetical protein
MRCVSSTVVDNSAGAAGDAGGFYLDDSLFWAHLCEIRNNTARRGGAFYARAASTLNVTWTRIVGNTAVAGGGVYFEDPGDLPRFVHDSFTLVDGNSGFDIATASNSIELIRFPRAMQPGRSYEDANGDPPMVHVLDGLGQVSLADDETVCEASAVKVTEEQSDIILQNWRVTAKSGQVTFDDFVILGTIATQHNVTLNCSTMGAVPNMPLDVAPCEPGSALSKIQVCDLCPVDSYSVSGRACLACPPGAECQRWIPCTGDVCRDGKAAVGVSSPVAIKSYWRYHAPASRYEKCDFDIMEAWTKGICDVGDRWNSDVNQCVDAMWSVRAFMYMCFEFSFLSY